MYKKRVIYGFLQAGTMLGDVIKRPVGYWNGKVVSFTALPKLENEIIITVSGNNPLPDSLPSGSNVFIKGTNDTIKTNIGGRRI